MSDVSAALGEYMLKGWVLTDDICAKCNATPLLRSSSRSTPLAFCARCDKGPNGNRDSPASAASSSTTSTSTAQPPTPLSIPPPSSSPSESSSHLSGTSTPPTEVSSALSSPTFAAPAETAESLRRREQSDQASREIGQRLLKGWAMLAEECANVRCYGVPLVRPPKAGGGKDVRMVCVICSSTYVTEVDASGWERLVLYENRPAESAVVDSAPHRDESIASSSATPSRAQMMGQAAKTSTPTMKQKYDGVGSPIDASSQCLELALTALSTRLTMLSSSAAGLDVKAITETADAIGRTAAALTQVRELKKVELASS